MLMPDRRKLYRTNWGLLFATLLLFAVGLVNLYSASGSRGEEGFVLSPFYQKQMLWGLGGLAVMVGCMLFDYRRLERNMVQKISRGISRLEIYPEVINYTIQDPYVGYMLEGFDSHWTIVAQDSLNSISYTNLPAGNFTFHLAVFDNNQEKILSERTYDFAKEKEMYDNSWFIFYILSVPMFTVFWVTWLLVKRHENKMKAAAVAVCAVLALGAGGMVGCSTGSGSGSASAVIRPAVLSFSRSALKSSFSPATVVAVEAVWFSAAGVSPSPVTSAPSSMTSFPPITQVSPLSVW